MGIRARLLVAMGYVGLTVVVALAVPLSATLERRARTALENRNLVRATALAQRLNDWSFSDAGLPTTQDLVDRAARRFDGRILVVDASGGVVADSGGAASGTPYATAGRPEIGRALAGSAWSSVRYSTDLGMDLMATAVPIVEEVEGTGEVAVLGAIRITQTMEEADEAVRRTTLGLIGLGATALAAALGLAWFLAGSLARPLRALADTAHRFGNGDLAARTGSVGTATEVVEVAGSFDAMADRMERLVRAQREFVADASHQIRTPLTGVKLQLEDALAADPAGPATGAIRAAEREVDRLTEIVSRLLTKAAGEGAPKEAIAGLRAVADRAQARWRDRVDREGRTIDVDGVEVRVLADDADLDEICDTLIENALRHGAGPIRLVVDVDQGTGRLRVTDRGSGIAPEDRDRVTERFERGRDASGEGTGLGLAIARELAERWGGALAFDAADGLATAAVRFRLATRGGR